MIEINTKIEPLREDLGRIIPPSFLLSTPYKRWLVSSKLDEVWKECIQIAENRRRGIYPGCIESDAKDALTLLLNTFFNRHIEKFVTLICDLLRLYHEETKECIDVTDIRRDMEAIGIENSLIKQLDDICEDKPVKEITEPIVLTEEEKIRQLEDEYKRIPMTSVNSSIAINAYLEWHKAALLYFSRFYTDMNSNFKEFKDLDNSGNGHSLRSNFNKIYAKYNLLMNNVNNMPVDDNENKKKSPMVFISHNSKDKDFVEPLVDLLESIKLNKDTLFCSSVAGYGLGLSENIFDTLRALFKNHDLYMIFIHSPRYYQSPVSLNEMGAAWILRTDFCSFFTKDMDFTKLKGVINGSNIGIKVDADDAAGRLNELYDKLQKIFNLTPLDPNTWERKRNAFLRLVNAIEYKE